MATIQVLKSKIHRAIVTQCKLDYNGSITIDEDLMDEANIIEYEKVQVVNINNGARLETYVNPGPRGSNSFELNGTGARLFQPNDKIIIMSYCSHDLDSTRKPNPIVVLMEDK